MLQKIMLQDTYPVQILELPKNETAHQSVDDLIDDLKTRITDEGRQPGEDIGNVAYIGVFDHLDHTMSLGGEIAPGMKEARNLLFCFGYALPKPQMLALRPRSIGIADMGDKFIITYMEAPMPAANKAMASWVNALVG